MTRLFWGIFCLTVSGGIVLAVTTRASGRPWIEAVGPNHDPVFIRGERRVYIVADDGGVRRCAP